MVAEDWRVNIAEVAAHIQVIKGSICRWVDAKGPFSLPSVAIILIQALQIG